MTHHFEKKGPWIAWSFVFGGKEMRKITISLTLALLLLSACAPKEEVQTITVGLECDYAPFNWTTSTSESDIAVAIDEAGAGFCDGYDIQVAQAIADGLDMTLVVKKMAWDGLITALNQNDIDMIVAGMTDTEERRQSVAFSTPYYASDLVLVVKASSTFAGATTLAEFTGASVIAQMGTFHDGLIDQITSVNHLTALGSAPLLVNSVQAGEADAMVTEYPVALSIVSSNPDLAIVQFAANAGFTTDATDTTVSVALRLADTELLADINTILATISEETRNTWMADAIDRKPQ